MYVNQLNHLYGFFVHNSPTTILRPPKKKFDFLDYPNLSFEGHDYKTFKNLSLAFLAANKGGSVPCVLNAANEIVVQAFLEERISFLKMSDIIENCMEKINFVKKPDLKSLFDIDQETRFLANSLIK